MPRGVIYIASGRSYIRDAKISARSVKRHNPSLSITLYTNEGVNLEVFDQVVPIAEPIENWGDSILSNKHFPYEQNLYLDADTFVCGDITEVFDLLARYDLAAAADASRGRRNSEFYEKIDRDLPSSFPEPNTGVMVYNRCTEVRDFFEKWNSMYRSHACDRNQPTFRIALYDGDIRYTTLSPEFNFRVDRVGYACGEVKILHTCTSNMSESELRKFTERVNACSGKRVITWDDYPCRVVSDSHRSRRYKWKRLMKRIKEKQREEGVVSLITSVASLAVRRLS